MKSELKQEAKQVVKLASMNKELPKSDKMMSVGSMLSSSDSMYVKEQALGSVCVQIEKEMFFLNKLHQVPTNSELVRQSEGTDKGQVIGLPAVVGG